MRRAKHLFLVGFLLAWSWTANAAPAVRLRVTNNPCLIMPCPPGPAPPLTVQANVSFVLYFAAISAANSIDINYSGTVRFASTDPLASLPGPYTFVAADLGGQGLLTVLRTPGPQTITITDDANQLIPGSVVLTVTGSGGIPVVPTVAGWAKILLVLLLASAGAWYARPAK